jgi:mRNA-degrading endonuclease toxin of MazEF toxin-antitoxin module
MRRGEIVYINLPLVPGSRVQGGHRPAVLVISDIATPNNPLVTIVPLTTNLGTKRFPLTFEIDPSTQNGLTQTSVALVFQLCSADRTNLGKVLGTLENHYLSKMDDMMRKLLNL